MTWVYWEPKSRIRIREWTGFFTGNSLRLGFRRRGILGRTQRNKLPLPRKTALKLIAHFRGRRRILGAAGDEGEEREEEKGFHLQMLMSETCFARTTALMRKVLSLGTCQRKNPAT